MEIVLRATKAAADRNRLRILRVLGQGPFNVAELTEILGLGQSTVSRHLRVLAEAGLVEARRAGTWAYYSLCRLGDGYAPELLSLIRDALAGAPDEDAPRVARVVAARRRATSEFFRRTADRWDRVRDEILGPTDHADRLVARVAEVGGTVVDLGTGTGVLLERLGVVAERVIGVDASPEMLDEARRRIDAAEVGNAELRLGSLEHLPLGDGEADVMVASLVLHHVADVAAVLREVRRGLASRGRVVVADLEEHAHDEPWARLGARWPGFRPDDLAARLRDAGFGATRVERLDPTDGASARPRIFLLEASRDD